MSRSYTQATKKAVDEEGWFSTGDVASIDPLGFMRITDRVKDVIKSGGEWISSIEIENVAMSHEKVLYLQLFRAPFAYAHYNSVPGHIAKFHFASSDCYSVGVNNWLIDSFICKPYMQLQCSVQCSHK